MVDCLIDAAAVVVAGGGLGGEGDGCGGCDAALLELYWSNRLS